MCSKWLNFISKAIATFIQCHGWHIHNRIKQYADHIFLYSHINSVADCIALQRDHDSLMPWSHSWLITFNPQKCEVLRITNNKSTPILYTLANKKSPVMHNYYIENCLIYEVFQTKYLGMTIDHKLPWNEHIQRIINKAVQFNSFLYQNLRHYPINIKYVLVTRAWQRWDYYF